MSEYYCTPGSTSGPIKTNSPNDKVDLINPGIVPVSNLGSASVILENVRLVRIDSEYSTTLTSRGHVPSL
ncbi:hypothetical protein WA026_005646, partial [Henosepilachna vigintioctopunctata]